MAGTTTIKRAMETVFKEADNDLAYCISLAQRDLIQWKDSDDYLYHFFNQLFWSSTETAIESAVAWYYLKSRILEGNIYMCYIPVPNWSPSNGNLLELENWNVNGVKFHPQNSPQDSDGCVELTENVVLKQLVISDTDYTSNLKELVLSKGTFIPLEAGYNSISKMHLYLSSGIYKNVCRLPYKTNGEPRIAIFYSNHQ